MILDSPQLKYFTIGRVRDAQIRGSMEVLENTLGL